MGSSRRSAEPSATSAFCLHDHFGQRHGKNRGDSEQGGIRRIPLTSLDPPDVAAVDPSLERKRLLREADLLSQLADRAAQSLMLRRPGVHVPRLMPCGLRVHGLKYPYVKADHR